jgi:hypothetical protein
MAHDLQAMVAWWRQRATAQEQQGRQGKVVRHTFHIEDRWLAAIRREAEATGETYAGVLGWALAAYFAGR